MSSARRELSTTIDAATVVSRWVHLQREGDALLGACPLHPDAARSFRLATPGGTFRCASCGASGDVVDLAQRYLGATERDAIRTVRALAGLEPDERDREAAREAERHRAACAFAAARFREHLLGPRGGAAREYLRARGIAERTIDAFGAGWAPPDGGGLADALAQLGLTEPATLARLLVPAPGAEREVHRDRIILPVRTLEGEPVAFLGRLVGSGEHRYVLPAESVHFRAGRALFGLERARPEIRRRGVAIVVEGPFDCMWLHQLGLANTVALCPFDLSPTRMQLLREAGAEEVVFLLDGDGGGRDAIFGNAPNVLTHRFPARVATLPDGEDPDTYAMKAGRAGVERLLAEARPLVAHLLSSAAPRGRASTSGEREAALAALELVGAYLHPDDTRAAFSAAVADHVGVAPEAFQLRLQRRRTP